MSKHPPTTEPPLSPEVASRRKGLRTGWTTGTCASAAAKAAVIGLVSGQPPPTVNVALPGGRRVAFPVERDGQRPYRCAVIKDAGDDPDCTDGAHVTATAEWNDHGALDLIAGEGIGVVTLPGLGIDVGQPSITCVPRRMIAAAVAEVAPPGRGVTVTFSVPGGEAMAARTSNERLGIVGGISILGTTGVVRPFSTAAYRASVVQQIDVAGAQGQRTVVLATGSRSDDAAHRLWPDLAPVCFVEVGDFTGIALRRAAGAGITEVLWVGMVGKIAKLADGVMMTHFRRSSVDGTILESAAKDSGASEDIVVAARATATARHFFDACVAAGDFRPLDRLCGQAASSCRAHVGDGLSVEVVMVDFEGERVVARG